jgi:hypothetical protein
VAVLTIPGQNYHTATYPTAARSNDQAASLDIFDQVTPVFNAEASCIDRRLSISSNDGPGAKTVGGLGNSNRYPEL